MIWERFIIPLCITFEVLVGLWVLNPSDVMHRANVPNVNIVSHGICEAQVLKADGSPDLMWCEDGAWKIQGKKWKWAGKLTAMAHVPKN